MGYKFQLKKQEREKLLREKSKNELLGGRDDLFVQAPAAFAVTYTCNLRKQALHVIRPGLIGLLVVDNQRIVFWKTETLGYICEDDTPEDDAAPHTSWRITDV